MVTKMVSEKAYIEISSEIAKEHDVKDGDIIEVTSSNGETVRVIAKINDGLLKDEMYGPMHYIEINMLTKGKYDTYSREPSYKYVTCNLKKID